ncbi:helix-turn-helix domain-containing protein [Cohnella cellulosilytica]|uniref:Helix-turn-helix domain-containing protein n=1 Tax=Cohnella cellulosilytica TaxID=986710 RepID=A0ABW2F2N6_9BACL
MIPFLYELIEARRVTDREYPLRAFPHALALLVPSEAVQVKLNDRTCELRRKQIMLLSDPDCDFRLLPAAEPGESGEPGELQAVVFRCYRLTAKEDDRLRYSADREHLPEHGRLMNLTRHTAELLQSVLRSAGQGAYPPDSRPKHENLRGFMEALLANDLTGAGFPERDVAIRQAVEYIESRSDKPLSRSMVAGMTGFNESYFSSLFRKETGWSFGDYVSRVRIDEAKRRLLGTSEVAGDVAYRVGFSDSSYFGKAFKKYAGMSPGQFRRLRGTTRIAAMQFYGALLALDIVPLAGTREVLRSSLLLREELAGMAVMEELGQMESLTALKPELILAPSYYYNMPDVLQALESVAPVVSFPWGKRDKLEEVEELGKLLDRSAQAKRWIERYRKQARNAKERVGRIADAGETVGLYELWNGNRWMLPHWPVRSAHNVYSSLGLSPQTRIREEVLEPNEPGLISDNELAGYAADHMFAIVPSDEPESWRERLMQRDVWRELVEGRGCRLYLLSLNEFWMDDGVSLSKQLDALVSLMERRGEIQPFYHTDIQ